MKWSLFALGEILCLLIYTHITPARSKSPESNRFRRNDNEIEKSSCRLYLARSIVSHNQFGIFTAVDLQRGEPIASDIIIPVTDYDELLEKYLISQYSWHPHRFGLQFEARTVAGFLSGIGSIASATTDFKLANALAFGRRDFDEGNVPRNKFPGAGAFSHYHNVTFYSTKDVKAGSEILIYYGDEVWYNERNEKLRIGNELEELRTETNVKNLGSVKNLDWYEQNGFCLDRLIAGQSLIDGAGRGAFSKSFIPSGTKVVTSPLIPIDRKATISKKTKYAGNVIQPTKQLLLNYCLGHEHSSLLFLPTAPIVNLINHGSKDDEANVQLKWTILNSLHNGTSISEITLEDMKSLLFEDELFIAYIAVRDIMPGEEIIVNYGTKWEEEWEKYRENWSTPSNADSYSSSYIMDEVVGLIRTEKEQINHPYPNNIMTGCFYRYSTRDLNEGTNKKGEVTVVNWKVDRLTFEYDNLRPCDIVQREEEYGHVLYTVIIKNWFGLSEIEQIPKGQIHVVKSVPRHAIRFLDKPYSTDQHLNNTYRHEIQIPNEIFPSHWMDLKT